VFQIADLLMFIPRDGVRQGFGTLQRNSEVRSTDNLMDTF